MVDWTLVRADERRVFAAVFDERSASLVVTLPQRTASLPPLDLKPEESFSLQHDGFEVWVCLGNKPMPSDAGMIAAGAARCAVHCGLDGQSHRCFLGVLGDERENHMLFVAIFAFAGNQIDGCDLYLRSSVLEGRTFKEVCEDFVANPWNYLN